MGHGLSSVLDRVRGIPTRGATMAPWAPPTTQRGARIDRMRSTDRCPMGQCCYRRVHGYQSADCATRVDVLARPRLCAPSIKRKRTSVNGSNRAAELSMRRCAKLSARSVSCGVECSKTPTSIYSALQHRRDAFQEARLKHRRDAFRVVHVRPTAFLDDRSPPSVWLT